MKAKKLISIMLAGAASMSLLTGCGSSEKQTAGSQAAESTQAETTQAESKTDGTTENGSVAETGAQAETTAEAAASAAGDGKALVVYYSASGNTARVAKAAAEAVGVDLFEIVPS